MYKEEDKTTRSNITIDIAEQRSDWPVKRRKPQTIIMKPPSTQSDKCGSNFEIVRDIKYKGKEEVSMYKGAEEERGA
jgi:hypothetical protein